MILLLHHEVQRSYDFVETTARETPSNTSNIYMAIDKLEVELPVVLHSAEKKVSKSNLKKEKGSIRKFNAPFELRNYAGAGLEELLKATSKDLKGKSIQLQIVGPEEAKSPDLSPEKIGRVRITLKPIVNQ